MSVDLTKKMKMVGYTFVIAATVAITILICFNIVKNESNIITNEETSTMTTSLIECQTTLAEHPVFTFKDASSIIQEVRLSLRDEEIYAISYIYNGIYENAHLASYSEAVAHTAYNTFLGMNKINAPDFYANFTSSINKMTITMYDDSLPFDSRLNSLFFIDSDSDVLLHGSKTKLVKELEKKGFSCKVDK